MKIKQILPESNSADVSHRLIQRQLKHITDILKNFSENVNQHGYETTRSSVIVVLQQDASNDWLIKSLASSDPKVQKAYNNLLALRQELLNQINSGI